MLKGDVPWGWFPKHDSALDKLKSVLGHAPALRFYDTNMPTTLQVDVSKSMACLMHQGQPVAYVSRVMSYSEINYAPMEKEMLGIVFGCEEFTMYIDRATLK